MLTMNDLKIGTSVTWKNEPHIVIAAQHVQMGRGGAILRTKLRNLLTGNVFEETFKGGDRLEEAGLNRGKACFLYHENGQYHFMDNQTFEEFSLSGDALGTKKNFLIEGQEIELLSYKGRAVRIELPIKMTFTVTQTVDAGRGNTAQGTVTKEATIDTGTTIRVPLFVQQNDQVVVNTETGEYVERA